ncbi:MAG TPA: winged helix-turn-helix domain-containing protein [Limnochordia bacterium]
MDEAAREWMGRVEDALRQLQCRMDQLEARIGGPEAKGGTAYKETIPEEGMERAAALGKVAREENVMGLLEYYGSFSADGRRSIWASRHVIDALLEQDDHAVARVLAAIGQPQRLQILKALLIKPRTAAELVRDLQLGTTGQAYHHLRTLLAADLIRGGDERGIYECVPHRVQALVLLLAGAHDALDTRYSAGAWPQLDASDGEEAKG